MATHHLSPFQAGFTLLELIVVLVMVSTISAIALPNLVNLYTSAATRLERDSILDQIGAMGEQALLNQKAYVLLSSQKDLETEVLDDPDLAQFHAYPLEIPAGWDIELDEPLITRANGVCLGGEIKLLQNRVEKLQIELAPPFCHVTP
ncbi:MAG: hypothetical protein CMQ20_08055 [Gammaproteobacteria bacterium]|nr:hypothetical protein [Gammaproteobacteria bacterium]